MNDEQIVLSLLKFYKNEGIDLYKILDDPIFDKLSIQTKIQTIKTHAQALHDGTSAGVTGKELRSAGTSMFFQGLMGAMTGAAASAATAKLFAGGRISPAAILIGAAPGMGFGLGMSALQHAGEVRNRNRIRGYLAAAASDPSDDTALGTLAMRNLQRGSSSSNPAFNKFLGRIEGNTDQRSHDAAMKQTIQDNVDAGRSMLDQ